MNKVKMYCVKCKIDRVGEDKQTVKMKSGGEAAKAYCEVCGTTMIKVSEDTTKINKVKKIEEIDRTLEEMGFLGLTGLAKMIDRLCDKVDELVKTLNLLSEAKKK